MMNILFIGDIVGSPGRRAVKELLPVFREQEDIDMVVANAENAAGGRGITPKLADELFRHGVDIITLGDHTWDQRDLPPYLDCTSRILRPANFPPHNPGSGWCTVPLGDRTPPVTVLNLIGRVFMPPHYDCPFRTVDHLLKTQDFQGHCILVDMHAEATSEKIAMGRYLEGRVSAVVGSHTHVQTADEKILSGGTAYITDMGMTGPKNSVLGREVQPVLHRFVTGMPARFDVAKEDIQMEGVCIRVDNETGKALQLERIQLPLREVL